MTPDGRRTIYVAWVIGAELEFCWCQSDYNPLNTKYQESRYVDELMVDWRDGRQNDYQFRLKPKGIPDGYYAAIKPKGHADAET